MKMQNLNSPTTAAYTNMHEDSEVLKQKDWGCLNVMYGLRNNAVTDNYGYIVRTRNVRITVLHLLF